MNELILGVMIVIVFLLGLYLLSGKGIFLIAGFNMLPKEQLMKINQVGLCKFMGKIVVGISISLFCLLLSTLLDNNYYFNAGLILLVILVIVAIVWTSIIYRKPLRSK